MKRFAIKDYGTAKDVLIEIEAEPRAVDASHVRVKLLSFAINPYDIALRQGAMRDFRTLKFPYVLGNDGAGIVTEVGSEIAHVKIGDEVIVHAVGGTYGEEVVVPEETSFNVVGSGSRCCNSVVNNVQFSHARIR